MIAVSTNSKSIIEALGRIAEGLERAAVVATKAASDAAAHHAQNTKLFKDQTGRTRSRIFGRSGLGGSSTAKSFVRARGRHIFALHDGSRAHFITARPGGVLRFKAKGRWVATKVVRHPGTSPRPFMHEAFLHGSNVLRRRLQQETQQVLQGRGGRVI